MKPEEVRVGMKVYWDASNGEMQYIGSGTVSDIGEGEDEGLVFLERAHGTTLVFPYSQLYAKESDVVREQGRKLLAAYDKTVDYLRKVEKKEAKLAR